MSNRTALVTLSFLISAAPASAGGLERTWIEPLGGPFDTAASWSPVGVPGALDTAVFDLDLTYGISFAQLAANELMNISEGDVTFDLSSLTYTLNGAVVGDNPLDVATLTLVNGALAIELLPLTPLQIRIGKDLGAAGTLVVSTGASLTSDDVILVGDGGTGTLLISGGGSASTGNVLLADDVDSTGNATVQGSTSSWSLSGGLSVGNEGTATMFITSGGSLTTMAPTNIGDSEEAVGTATVQGVGSSWTASAAIDVGNLGSGSLGLNIGATLTSARVKIGDQFGGDGTMTVNGPTTSWTDSLGIWVGNVGTGSLQITGGATVSTVDSHVGKDVGSTGTALVDGAGSSWSSSVELIVGVLGSGTLTASNGGAVSAAEIIVGQSETGELDVLSGASAISTINPVRIGDLLGSDGTINVDGTGSTLTSNTTLFVGNIGTGTLNITDGGSVLAPNVFVADDPGSSGTVEVDGPGATWTVTGTPFLGDGGTGVLRILDGGTATLSGITRIGDDLGSDGSVFVSGSGSTLNIQAELFVGNFSSGSVSVTNGGAVNTARVKLGDEIGATGTASISGAASTWTDTNDIFVGNFGSGSLTISNGATLSGVRGTLGDDPGSDGTVTISGAGSSWANSQQLLVGDLGQGTLTLVNSGQASAPVVSVNGQSVIEGNGTVVGALTSSGTIQPGLSVGEIVVTGSYTQTGQGSLDIELACPAGDQLNVSGAVSLAGTLNLSLVTGSEPYGGQQFEIVTGASVSGVFGTVNAPAGVNVSYEPGAVVVTVLVGGPPAPGDIDGDGIVGITDFLALLAAWGPNPGHPADLDGDGFVGITDFLLLLANWGPACP